MDQASFEFVPLASTPASQLSIHDFVPANLPFDAVVGAFTHFVTPELIGGIVVTAWSAEARAAGRITEGGDSSEAGAAVRVDLGDKRARRDALVVPLRWKPIALEWIPSLQADLEIVSFGQDRTHLHVLGQSWLPPGTEPQSDKASLDQRLTVALVRHVLTSLTEVLTETIAGFEPEPMPRVAQGEVS